MKQNYVLSFEVKADFSAIFAAENSNKLKKSNN